MSEQKTEEYADKVGKALDLLMPVIVGDRQEFPVYTGEHGNGVVKIDVISDTLDDTHGANNLISALHKAKINYTFTPAKQEHNGGSFITIDTKQEGFAEKWEGLVANFYAQTAARIAQNAELEMDKCATILQTTSQASPSTQNPEGNVTPIFIENSWKNALAYLKTLPHEQQVYLLQEMHTNLTLKAQQIREQVNASPTTQVEKLALLKPLAGITSNPRDR